MKIGFDFDGTVDIENLWSHSLVKSLLKDPENELFLITTRIEPNDNKVLNFDQITVNNKEVIKIADHLNIKRENIFFTNFEWKFKLLEELDIDIFFDNNEIEVHLINTKCFKCQGILVNFDIKPKWLKELIYKVEKKIEFE